MNTSAEANEKKEEIANIKARREAQEPIINMMKRLT
jgi:hypothetical protein